MGDVPNASCCLYTCSLWEPEEGTDPELCNCALTQTCPLWTVSSLKAGLDLLHPTSLVPRAKFEMMGTVDTGLTHQVLQCLKYCPAFCRSKDELNRSVELIAINLTVKSINVWVCFYVVSSLAYRPWIIHIVHAATWFISFCICFPEKDKWSWDQCAVKNGPASTSDIVQAHSLYHLFLLKLSVRASL